MAAARSNFDEQDIYTIHHTTHDSVSPATVLAELNELVLTRAVNNVLLKFSHYSEKAPTKARLTCIQTGLVDL